jgi:hypothetical protein
VLRSLKVALFSGSKFLLIGNLDRGHFLFFIFFDNYVRINYHNINIKICKHDYGKILHNSDNIEASGMQFSPQTYIRKILIKKLFRNF